MHGAAYISAWLLIPVAAFAAADLPPLPRSSSARAIAFVRGAPATSSDNFIKVYAHEDESTPPPGFRRPILLAASELCDALAQAFCLKMPSSSYAGLVIHVGEDTKPDTRVISRIERGVGGTLLTRVFLPSPQYSDLDLFKRAVAAAWFRSWIDRSRSPESREGLPCELPDWVVDGALRSISPETRLADASIVLDMWRSGKLPYFPKIASNMGISDDKSSAFSGFVVDWMREAHQSSGSVSISSGFNFSSSVSHMSTSVSASSFATFLSGLAAGKPWSVEAVVATLTGCKDLAGQDRAFDERMARLSRAVLMPGRPCERDILTFDSHLFLYPPFFDMRFGGGTLTACSFRDAIGLSETDSIVRLAAILKARELRFLAIGRGDKMSDAAEAYTLFLNGLARGVNHDRLEMLLDDADVKLEIALEAARKGQEIK